MSAARDRPRVGVVLPGPTASEGRARTDVVSHARHLETLGFDSLWAGDHLATGIPSLDCFTALSAAAAVTERIRLGTGVLVPALRSTAWAAKQVASLRLLSGDRLLLGVGSGGPWPEEWEAAGATYEARGRLTDEALAVIPSLVEGAPTLLPGPDRPVVHLEPGVPAPPILIGGSSHTAMRRAARHGDGWFPSMVAPHTVRSGRELIETENGCSKEIVVGLVASLQTKRATKAEIARELAARYDIADEAATDLPITGSPEQAAERLREFIDAGATHFAVGMQGDDWERQTELLAHVREILHRN